MQFFLIPANVANALGMYLMTRPMGEVEQLVNELRRLQPAPTPEPEPQQTAN